MSRAMGDRVQWSERTSTTDSRSDNSRDARLYVVVKVGKKNVTLWSSYKTKCTLVCPVNQQVSTLTSLLGGDGEARTTTSFASAGTTRLSSQYSHPPLEAINAVSMTSQKPSANRTDQPRTPLTMPGAQCSEMIRHRIQIIPVRRELAPRVVRRKLRYAASTRREG